MDIFGQELAVQFDCQTDRAPPVVLKCIEAVEQRGLRLEGIYRISPSLGEVNKLKEALNRSMLLVKVVFINFIYLVYDSNLCL